MKSGRKQYLDNIRWITVCIVVIYHVIYMFNGVQTFGVVGPFREAQWQDAFLYFVYPWFMSLLFVVSGMSAKYYLDNHDTKEFMRTRTRKLLVPSTIGLLVFWWILGYYNMQISNAFQDMQAVPKPVLYLIMAVSGTGPLWYIQMLWILSLVLVLIRKVEKGKLLAIGAKTPALLLLGMVVVYWGMAQILNTPMITVYRFGVYGFSFFVGYFCLSHEEVMGRLAKLRWGLTIVAIVLGTAYTIIYFGENYAAEPCINNVLACVYGWITILAILAMMYQYGNFTSKATNWMVQKSWGLYLFHYLPLAVVSFYLKQFVADMPAVTVYILVGFCCVAGAFVLDAVVRKIPFLRWSVMGIKGKKNVSR